MTNGRKRTRSRIALLAVSVEGHGESLGAALASVTQQMRDLIASAQQQAQKPARAGKSGRTRRIDSSRPLTTQATQTGRTTHGK